MTANPTPKPNPTGERTHDAPCPAINTETMSKKILVLDDDPQVRESLRKVLRAEGYEVALAANAQEGIEKFSAERMDLLLLDLNLPDHSGWDVFGTLTSLNPFVPIVIITGRHEQYELAAGAGVGALIEKPLNVPRLLETVKKLLAEPPVVHLKRLASHITDTRHVPPPSLSPGVNQRQSTADSS